MLGKKVLWLVLAITILANAGCCRMWERWCDRPNCPPYCPPAPHYCPPDPCRYPPPPGPSQAVPVPSSSTSWQRCP